MGKKKDKALKQERIFTIQSCGGCVLGNCKSKCCKKYKKSEAKRCKKCPCFDLIKKIAKNEAA